MSRDPFLPPGLLADARDLATPAPPPPSAEPIPFEPGAQSLVNGRPRGWRASDRPDFVGPKRPVGWTWMTNPQAGPGRAKGSVNAKTQITHDALIDFMLANPRATLIQIAQSFGWKSVASVSIILNSDAFQAAYARRKAVICDPVVTATVEERIRGLAARSAEILAEKLEQQPSEKLVMEVFKESTRAGAYGVKAPVAVQTQFVVALPGPASNSTEWLERFRPNTAGVVKPRIDDAPIEVPSREVP